MSLSSIPSSVTLQGKTYQLKPYSRLNERILAERAPELEALLTKGEISKWEYYDRLLRLVIEGPYEFDTQSDTFDAREAEAVVLSFVPPSMQAYVLLQGFQQS
jgi:hypothetical protein